MEQSASYPYAEDAVSAVSTGANPLELQHLQFSPRDLIVEAVDDFVTRMGDRDISVVSDIFYSVPETVFGDGRGLRRLLDSVFDNAGNLTRRGRIHVECRFENGIPDPVLVLTVRFTRIGIRFKTPNGAPGRNYFSVRIPVARS